MSPLQRLTIDLAAYGARSGPAARELLRERFFRVSLGRDEAWVALTARFQPSTPFDLEVAGNHLRLRDGRGRHRVACLPVTFDAPARAVGDRGVLLGRCLTLWLGNPQQTYRPYNAPFFGPGAVTGLGVPVHRVAPEHVGEVVDLVEDVKNAVGGPLLVRLSSGLQTAYDLENMAPYIAGLKASGGVLVGIAAVPTGHVWRYDWLRDVGVDQVAFPLHFLERQRRPAALQEEPNRTWFNAMEYVANLLPPGGVALELALGTEAPETTLKMVRYALSIGAIPEFFAIPGEAPGLLEEAATIAEELQRHRQAALLARCPWARFAAPDGFSLMPTGSLPTAIDPVGALLQGTWQRRTRPWSGKADPYDASIACPQAAPAT